MRNEKRKIISESRTWNSSEIEGLSEALLFENTIGNHLPQSFNEDETSAEYFIKKDKIPVEYFTESEQGED